jgi:hypothetical protein
MKTTELKLLANIEECNKHIYRMFIAYSEIIGFIPLDSDSYKNLKDNEITYIDQYLFRFAMLQDTMGEKLFRNLITLIGEDSIALTFIDILNRLEKFELLKKDSWFDLRRFRNLATHEYPDTEEIIISTLNELFKNTKLIYSIFIKTKDFVFIRVLKNYNQKKYLTLPFPKGQKE